tara:strand:+ start:9079 stop:9987 length:909 start_codon:yes stop_codon:yes gene_type:complete
VIKLPSSVKTKTLIDDIRNFSWEASEILIGYSQILKDSNDKSNILKNDNINDPVTLADLQVNELIIKKINEKYKYADWEILSEENVKSSYVQPKKDSNWVWVLDPLDGTKDFIQGTGNYAMHLALNYKRRPYMGIILIPEKDELWIADGEKVWCEKRDGTKKYPNVSRNKLLKEMTLVTSKNHRNETLRELIKKIDFKKVIVMGSIGCKISSIVRGESDIYICLSLPEKSSPKDWDFAAPEAVLKSSGGAITNIYNEDLTYGESGFSQGGVIVASNNKVTHEKLCLEIKDIIKENNLYPLTD